MGSAINNIGEIGKMLGNMASGTEGLNPNTFKDMTEVGKGLLNIGGMGKTLSEEEINSKPITELGISGNPFSDIADMSKKLNDLAKLTKLLNSLGINKDMIAKLLDMASTIGKVAENFTGGSATDKTLKEVGLNNNVLSDMNSVGEILSGLGEMGKKFAGSETKSKQVEEKTASMDAGKLVDGLGSVLGMLNKK